MPDHKSRIISAVRSENEDAGRVIGRSLKTLREMVGLTQEEMALRLGVGQAAISKIERRGDVQISSLQRYVEALGATLQVRAAFAHNQISQFGLSFDAETSDEDQFILPIFGSETFVPQRDVVLSIRPQYSEKILDGRKTVELRRRFPVSVPAGAIAYIYSTSPVRAIVGCAEISEVVKLPVEKIWRAYHAYASIERIDFESYFAGVEEGVALEFANVRPLSRVLDLAELRERFGFEPPQSFLYVKPELRRALRNEYTNVSH